MKAATFFLLCSLLSGAALAQGAADAPAAAPAPSEETPAGDEPQDEPQQEQEQPGTTGEPTPLPLPGADGASDDDNAPIIEDVAVAASSPSTAPMVTAVITDDWSGVEKADVYFRRPGASTYEKTPLHPGTGGLFIGRLPDGTQTTGFEYYVEVWDAANNGPTRTGTPEEPLQVQPAAEGTVARLEREQDQAALGPVHPAWMMLSLGGGVLAAAASGVFWLDFMNLQAERATETNPERQTILDQALLGDMVIGSVLGVVATAGIATGVGLLVYSALEE